MLIIEESFIVFTSSGDDKDSFYYDSFKCHLGYFTDDSSPSFAYTCFSSVNIRKPASSVPFSFIYEASNK